MFFCVTYLNSSDFFSIFNKEKFICLTHFYPDKLSIANLMVLDDQLDSYIIDPRNDDEFSNIEGIAIFVEKMVKTKNDSLKRVFQICIYFWYIYLSNCYYFYQLQLL